MARASLILANIWLFAAVVFYGFSMSSSDRPSDTDEAAGQDDFSPLEIGTLVDTAEAALPPSAVSDETGTSLDLRTNQAGIDLLKEREGLRLEAYYGPAGTLLIGYGHAKGVTPGMTITAAEAESLLRDDLSDIERQIKQVLRVDVNENEFSAMVVLAYNIGTGAFSNSTVVKELNAGNRQAAADAFLMWNKIKQNGQMRADPHLTENRSKERNLFLS